MENRDDELYGPKDLLSPATREEFLYIKSDMPAQTGLIEDSPAVAIGLQQDWNHISDWLKANLPAVMFALLILSIVSLTFTGHWNRGPEYSGIPILENYNEDTVEQKTLIPPDQAKPDWKTSFKYDAGEFKSNLKRYSDADKKHITPLLGINNKPEIENTINFIKMETSFNIELPGLVVLPPSLNTENYSNFWDYSRADSFWVFLPPMFKEDTLSTLNHLTYFDSKSNKLIDWAGFNYAKEYSSVNQNYLSYYDKNGLHWNSIISMEKPSNSYSLQNSNQHIDSLRNKCKELLTTTGRSVYATPRKAKLRNTSTDAGEYAIKIIPNPGILSKSNRRLLLNSANRNNSIKSICVLNVCVTGYQKTDLKIDTSTIVYLSGHSKIIYDSCGITSGPEGIKHLLQITSPDCAPLDPNYNLGALLFRIGENDAWKPYTGDHMLIKIDKPGVLEFTINLKSTKNIKGNYQVLAYEKASEADRK